MAVTFIRGQTRVLQIPHWSEPECGKKLDRKKELNVSFVVDKSGAVYAGPFPLGMNNRQPDYALPEGSVRNAVNADVDIIGHVRRRDGYTKIVGGLATHSGWSGSAWTLYVDGAWLRSLNSDNSTTALCQVAGPVCYEEFNGVVYFSDGVGAFKLSASGVVTKWGIEVPATPVLTRSSGTLGEGTYLVAITPIGSDDTEHGASEAVAIDLPTDSSIIVSMPSGYDTQIAYFRVYVTSANGETLYAVADVPVGAISYTITAPGQGDELETMGITPPPAGYAITEYNGVMYVATGKVVWHTEPFAPDRLRPSTNYLPFTSDVDVMVSSGSGIWFAAGKTYFYAGTTPDKFSVVIAAEYGAPRGNAYRVPDTEDVMWYSSRGIVRASDGMLNLQEKNVAAESGTTAAIVVREQNGVQQAIASVSNPTVSQLASRSFLDMEVIRKAG